MLASGTKVGRYVVLDQLGEGAMGEVYRAWDDALDRIVALKLLLPLRADNAHARKRFARESRMAARINHPAVAHVYDVGEHESVPFIAMEFVPGRQLRNELGTPMPQSRVLDLLQQILQGLHQAHAEGVVHRDLKPENILISGRDQIKILDFGLAKPVLDEVSEATSLSNTGITGTPRYMAPEQIQGTPVDPRTDIYALGTVLYEMLTGAQCHTGRTLGELLVAVVHKPAPELPPDACSPELAALVRRALEKKPEHRFADAASMLDAVQAIRSNPTAQPILHGETPDPPHPRAMKYALRARQALTGISTPSGVALDLAEQALRIDPELALAHALYAEAAAALFNTGHLDTSWLDRAQTALEKAEALAPSLPDVRVARARLLWTKTFNFPAETALRELRAALIADPDHVGALRLWATIAAHVGLFEQAEGTVARRLAVDPHDEVMVLLSASLYLITGRPDRAAQSLARPLRLDPKHEDPLFWWLFARAQILRGQCDEAEQALQINLDQHANDPLSLGLMAVIHAQRAHEDPARQLMRRAEANLKAELHPRHCYHLFASVESLLKNTQASLHWLQRAADCGLPCWPWFMQDPLLTDLRSDSAGEAYLLNLKRRFDFFRAEFPLNDPATVGFVATEVSD